MHGGGSRGSSRGAPLAVGVRHYTADELLAYVVGNDAIVDLGAVEIHVRSCTSCTEVLREVTADFHVLSTREIWEDEEKRTHPHAPRSTARAATDLGRQLAAEEKQATATMAILSRLPIDEWIAYIAAGDAPCTPALVRLIIEMARETEEATPQDAMQLLDVAGTLVSRHLPADHAATDEVTGDLWKERANVQTILGDYQGALLSLDLAERAYSHDIVAEFALAFVAWGRANVYFEMEAYRGAMALARAAAKTFRIFGDKARALQLDALQAAIRYEQGDVAGAEEQWRTLLPKFERTGDAVSVARTLANIACCRVHAGDRDGTEDFATKAMFVYASYGMTTEITRTRWALARSRLRSGDTAGGEAALAAVAAEFEALGLVADAGSVRLDLVESFIARKEFRLAAAIARDLVSTFTRIGAQLSVVRALTALREAAEANHVTPQFVRAVRHTLAHPSQPFSPPN